MPAPGGVELPESVAVSRIDPQAETERYAAEHRASTDVERAFTFEEVRSPCTTEVAVFPRIQPSSSASAAPNTSSSTPADRAHVALLDVTGAFHRQVMHDATTAPGRITTPLMRLQDPSFCRVVLVALAETTPVAEAAELQADLRRAGIEPFGWVLNAVLAGSGTTDPVLRAGLAWKCPSSDASAPT